VFTCLLLHQILDLDEVAKDPRDDESTFRVFLPDPDEAKRASFRLPFRLIRATKTDELIKGGAPKRERRRKEREERNNTYMFVIERERSRKRELLWFSHIDWREPFCHDYLTEKAAVLCVTERNFNAAFVLHFYISFYRKMQIKFWEPWFFSFFEIAKNGPDVREIPFGY